MFDLSLVMPCLQTVFTENVRIQQLPRLDGNRWRLAINSCMEKESKHNSTFLERLAVNTER